MIDLQVKMLCSSILLHGVRIYFEKGVAYYIQSLWIPMHWAVVTYVLDLVFIQNMPVTVIIDYTILSLLVASSCQSQSVLRIGRKKIPILLTALAYLFFPKPKILPADLARA